MKKNIYNYKMYAISEEIFKKRDIEKSTIKTYISNFTQITKLCKSKNIDFIDDFEFVNDKILLEYKDNGTIQNMFNVLYVLSIGLNKDEKLIEYYQIKSKYYKDLKDIERKSGKKTPFQAKNWLSWNDLIEYTNNMKNNLKSFSNDQMEKQYQYFMFAVLYTFTVPLRNQEYRLAVITENENNINDPTKNYIIVLEDKIYFKIFQTKNIKKLIKDDKNYIINNIWQNAEYELRNYIIYLKKINKWIDGGYLFYQNNMNRYMSDQTYIENIKKVFKKTKKEITIQLIRTIYETNLQHSEEYKAMTIEEQNAKHREALHDRETAMEYRKDD